MTAQWRLADAEAHLLSLELFGMRFGLDRMRRLLTALGSPQERFAAIHVVGTNGKSSTVRMCAALLEAHGVRTGSFLSPHLTTFAERIRIGDADLDPDAFGAAVQRTAVAAAKVDRTLETGDRVTQFELVTAAAFDELARRGVEVAVVEAGLGGRHDATNVLAAPVCVLTNVGLEHTRWLGPTVVDIAREKLAVVPAGATLVTGLLDPEVAELAHATGARVVAAEPLESALFGYQATNFAVAAAAARAHLGELDPRIVAEVAGAHPGAGADAGGRRRAADDLRRRAQPVRRGGARRRAPRPGWRAAARRGDLGARRQGRGGHVAGAAREDLGRRVHELPQPARAAAGDAGVAGRPGRRAAVRDRARSARCRGSRASAGGARRGGPGDRIDLSRGRPAGRSGAPEGIGAVNDRGPSVLAMVALVAVVVALVILVFFAVGYAFGRAFL